MPHKLAPVKRATFEAFLHFVGCEYQRQKGDHLVYWRVGLKRPVIFPDDTEIPVMVIKSNLRTLGISTKEYLEILSRL